MIYLVATILVLVNLAFLATVILGLPGNWLMLASTVGVAIWWWDEGMFSLWTLIAVLVIALLAELVEFLAGVAGAKQAGGGFWGSVGALVGGLVGGIVGTLLLSWTMVMAFIGTIAGAVVGAGVGAWVLEIAAGKQMKPAAHSGVGAGVGRLIGTVVKLAAGGLIWLIIAVAAYWP